MPLKKNKKEYKVSGNKSLPSRKFWSKSKEMRIQIAMPMRRKYIAWESGDWESFREEFREKVKRAMQRSRAFGKASKTNFGKER